MTDDKPPLYPFPEDTVLYHRADGDFDPSAESYFALGKPAETKVREIGGKTHTNPFRFVVRTPVRGSVAFEINEGDLASMFAIALAGLAHSDSGMYGDPEHPNQVTISPDYWEAITGLEIDVIDDD